MAMPFCAYSCVIDATDAAVVNAALVALHVRAAGGALPITR
jgi:hypothetical protein